MAPARRRIGTWVARATDEAREHRFRLLHDPLTGLPNAAYLQAHLERIAAATARASTQTAVLRVDFDRFRALRDALGPRTTDDVLRIAAHRVRKALRTGDFAAYLGQDDFVVVAGELDDANDAAAIAGRIQAALSKPFSIRGGARRLTACVGVTLLSDDSPEGERVLANAEIALAAAQAAGTGHVRYFRDDLRREVRAARGAACRAARGARRRGAGAVLPAAARRRDRGARRLRGAGALAASAPRPARAGRLPRPRRADRPDRADGRTRADPLA